MPDKPPSIRAAQALAIFLSTTTAGLSLGVSAVAVPRLLEAPTPLMLRQWERIRHIICRRTLPLLGTAAAAPYWYLAYRSPGLQKVRYLYLLAGGLCSVGPSLYALVVMGATERKLLRRAEQTRMMGVTDEVVEMGPREESAKYLVDWWGLVHLGRVVMVAVGGLVGLGASL